MWAGNKLLTRISRKDAYISISIFMKHDDVFHPIYDQQPIAHQNHIQTWNYLFGYIPQTAYTRYTIIWYVQANIDGYSVTEYVEMIFHLK